MGRLERKLDTDLIERIEANGPQSSKVPDNRRQLRSLRLVPSTDGCRKASTYRGARRNARREREKNIRNLREKQSGKDEASVDTTS